VDTVHECDRRTDRQRDRITITKTVQRRASHGKNSRLLACAESTDAGEFIICPMLCYSNGIGTDKNAKGSRFYESRCRPDERARAKEQLLKQRHVAITVFINN